MAQFPLTGDSKANTLERIYTTVGHSDASMSGEIDLAQLAGGLPHLFRIRSDTELESGSLEFSVENASVPGNRQLAAHLVTTPLAARRNGQQLNWNAPLQLRLQANDVGQGWQVEHLTCTSPFFSIEGHGRPEAGSFSLQCNLQELIAQLNELIDLNALRGAGQLTGQLSWQRDIAQSRVVHHATGSVTDLDLAGPGIGRWREPMVDVSVTLDSERTEQTNLRLRTARLRCATNTDQLELELLESVESPSLDSVWVIGCHANGHWATWFRRLQPFLPPTFAAHAYTLSGMCDLKLTTRICGSSIEFQEGHLTSQPLMLESPYLCINEPNVALDWKGQWNMATGSGVFPETTFRAAALAFSANDLRWEQSSSGGRHSCDIVFRTDLEQLYSTWRLPAKQHDWRLSGAAQGQVSLVHDSRATQLRYVIDMEDMGLARRRSTTTSPTVLPVTHAEDWVLVWQEPVLHASGSGQRDGTSGTLVLERFELEAADKISVAMRGSLAQPIGTCAVDLRGQVTYDLAKLLVQVAPQWVEHIQWSGHDSREFHLSGPLFQLPANASTGSSFQPTNAAVAPLVPTSLLGESSLAWQSAELFGITVGAGMVTAKLVDGEIHTDVRDLPISGGLMHITPTIQLNQQPPVVTIAAGNVLSDVRVTPRMCEQWLKYVAPMAVGATRAEGQFSVSLAHATLPLTEPPGTQATGTLQVHTASLGPGPLTQQLVEVTNRLRLALQPQQLAAGGGNASSWVQIPEQAVHFEVRNQRIYHDALTVQVSDLTITTRGSVGFDQSLAITAQFPIPTKWLPSSGHLALLKGHVVTVPVRGTLANPRIDSSGLEQITLDALRQTGGKILEDEIQKGLQRWLGRDR